MSIYRHPYCRRVPPFGTPVLSAETQKKHPVPRRDRMLLIVSVLYFSQLSISFAAPRPSARARTTRDWPLRISPALKIFPER